VVAPPCVAGSNNWNDGHGFVGVAAPDLTVYRLAEIVTDPVRAAPVLAVTENVSEPLPVPLAGLVSTMNPSC
jgi:hypothetical protein